MNEANVWEKLYSNYMRINKINNFNTHNVSNISHNLWQSIKTFYIASIMEKRYGGKGKISYIDEQEIIDFVNNSILTDDCKYQTFTINDKMFIRVMTQEDKNVQTGIRSFVMRFKLIDVYVSFVKKDIIDDCKIYNNNFLDILKYESGLLMYNIIPDNMYPNILNRYKYTKLKIFILNSYILYESGYDLKNALKYMYNIYGDDEIKALDEFVISLVDTTKTDISKSELFDDNICLIFYALFIRLGLLDPSKDKEFNNYG
ncbi:hypothetical protein [uncultured Clostridium sp.]|uniref:hypothetical protein n=1 Tax=uncultured Clostridium sp. TaxID=59620 RepID=UPI00263BCF32|nr:hypothetical protein [uncultured Clostridium sp.]